MSFVDTARNAILGNPTDPLKKPSRTGVYQAFVEIDEQMSMEGALYKYAARIKRGDAIKIACYGDSTTDGNNTTGWSANPVDGSGNAIGNSNHNLDAPNSWPVKLKALIDGMYPGNNVSVWNAGYSGREIQNGWAVNNYVAAIIDNPFYGVPDIVFIGFGLNDIRTAGSQIDTFDAQLRALISLIRSYGSMPIALTCDPAPNFTSGRDPRETTREIDQVKRAVCAAMQVPCVESGAMLERWIEKNSDGFRWGSEQDDYLHFKDSGHAMKAGFIAKLLYPDVVEVLERQRVSVAGNSQKSGSGFDSTMYGPYRNQNNRHSFNWNYNIGNVPSGTNLADMWVWCENPDASLVYRSLEGEGSQQFNRGSSDVNLPRVIIDNQLVASKTLLMPHAGFTPTSNGGGNYRRSDQSIMVDKLPWGLTRVRNRIGQGLVSGSLKEGYIGYFDIIPTNFLKGQNALKNSSKFRMVGVTGGVEKVEFLSEQDDGSNTVGCRMSGSMTDLSTAIDVYIDVDLPINAGVVPFYAQGYGTTQLPGDKSYFMLFRNNATILQLRNGYTTNGTVVYSASQAAGTIVDQSNYKFRVRMRRNNDNQIVDVFDSWNENATAIISVSKPTTDVAWFPFGGVAGGLFVNQSLLGANVAVSINDMFVRYP